MLFFGIFLVTKKFTDKNGGGEYEYIPSKFLVSQCLPVAEPLSISLIAGIEKILASECYVTIFRQSFFVSKCRKMP